MAYCSLHGLLSPSIAQEKMLHYDIYVKS